MTMDRIDAIIILLTGPAWTRLMTVEQQQERIDALLLVSNVTRAELADAKKRTMQQEAEALKAAAATKEAAAAKVTDWIPTDPRAVFVENDKFIPTGELNRTPPPPPAKEG
jgi:hypothetical protein